jgi:predicted O-linked N-acetylglucosamine transferase (SPINDLY family)
MASDTIFPQALKAHTAGDLAEAARLYGLVLRKTPRHHFALSNLSMLHFTRGELALAEKAARKAVAFNKAFPEGWCNLGLIVRALGRLDEAVACYGRALSLRAAFPQALNNLGIALKDLGRHQEALDAYRRALALEVAYPEAWCNLGNALSELGRRAEAVSAYRRALEFRPDYPDVLSNLGVALRESGERAQAIDCFGRALALQPGHADAWINLGNLYEEMREREKALECFGRALAVKPDAIDALAKLVHMKRLVCDWDGLAEAEERVRAAVRAQRAVITPFSFLSLSPSPEEQLLCARQWTALRTKAPLALPPPEPRHRDKIRLGYLSADFQEHPVSRLAVQMFELHDRTRFEVTAYSYGADDGSPMRRRLEAAFDRFVDIASLSYGEAATAIRADGIDILIDLTGYTTGGRAQILAARPAPLQVSLLGYPGSMGAPFIDYLIADPTLVPADQQRFYSEKLVHLPCYQPSDGLRRMADQRPSRAACGLPETGVVFLAMHNSYKIGPALFRLWMRLLAAVPGSVLWLYGNNSAMQANLARQAAACAVDPARLVFAPPVPMEDYLARLTLADLFLDAHPYGAGATANDALWAGVPIVTCPGEGYASRMAASLLHAVGLPELIAPTLDAYERLARELAQDGAARQRLSAHLVAQRSAARLFDCPAYVRNIEQAYQIMWQGWIDGSSLQPMEV